jgi:glycosyltransferase involved in cell wall biosynthesis
MISGIPRDRGQAMRVTFVLPDANLGGGTRVIAEYAKHLHQRGHSVFIVSTPPWNMKLRHKITTFLRGNPWVKTRKRMASHLDGMDLNHHVLKRRRPVTDRDVPDADVVIATWWETAPGVARLSPSKGAKAYFIQQYEVNFGQPVDQVDATWRLPLRKIVCARWLADLARDRFGDPTAIVSPNGLDLDFFQVPERGRQDRPTVGLLYSPVPTKGWDVGTSALRIVHRSMPDLRLLTFGGADPGDTLPSFGEYTRWPTQEQIRDVYSRCDLWLCSSRSEGYHLPPHEAMGCRCPVVSTRVGGSMDLIEDGINGYLVDVDNVDALADRAGRLLSLPEPSWKELSDAAFATAGRSTWAHATDVFERAIQSVAEASHESLVATADPGCRAF